MKTKVITSIMTMLFLASMLSISVNVAPAQANSTNPVVNGDFEAPIVSQPTYGWDIFDSGTTGLGWTVEWYDGSASYGGWSRPEPAHLELHRGVNNWPPHSGYQHAELDTDWDGPGGGLSGEPASVAIYQDILTVPGMPYLLKFYYSPRPDHVDNVLLVMWDGTIIETISETGGSQTVWHEQKHILYGAAGSDTTELRFIEDGHPDSLGMFLDDVSVIPQFVTVDIDIKPSSYPNSICLSDQGLLPVAILGRDAFDVTEIDASTIEIGGVSLATRGSWKAPKLACSYEDVNEDGYMDLVAFFDVQALDLTETTESLTLTAKLLDGTPIIGTDSVRVVPP